MSSAKEKALPTLDRMLGPEYTYTSSGQGHQTRQQLMDTIPIYDLGSFEFLKIDVRLYGDIVVAFRHYRQTAILNGSPQRRLPDHRRRVPPRRLLPSRRPQLELRAE